MPRIPDATSLGYSVPQTRTPRFQDRSGQIVGDATQRLAGTIGQVAGALQEHEDKFAYARAKSTLLEADVEARRELENDADWATYETRYSEKMAKAREKAAGLIRGNRDRALFDMDAKLDVERGVNEVRGLSKRKEIDWGRGALDATLEANRTAALNAKDEQTRAALIAATQDLIGGAKAKGYVSEQEAVNHQQVWTANYAEAYVGMQPASERIKLLSGGNALSEVYAKYPKLEQHGFQFRDSIGKGSGGRKLEFYPPGESHSPFEDKNKPGIERFDETMGPKDIFGEMLHYLPNADKRVGNMRAEFQDSITTEQKEKWLRGDYERQVRNKLFGDKTPTFDQWLRKQGGDAFFRGYLAGQYPEEAYTQEQKKLFEQLDGYLGEGRSSQRKNVADYIAPDRRAALLEAAKNENRDLTVRRESQAQEDAIVAKFGTGPAALKIARDIEDPEVRDSTVNRIKVRQAEAKQADVEYREAIGEEALAFLNGGGKFSDLPLRIKNGLKPSELNSLRSYAEQVAGGGTRRTNPETLVELSKIAGDDPQQFGDMDILSYRDKLSDSDFEEFVDLQRKIRSGNVDGKASGFMSVSQVRNERLAELFKSANPRVDEPERIKQERRRFTEKFETQLRSFKSATGKNATADDARKILDDMTAEIVIERPFWLDASKRAYEITIDDIPDADGREIVAELTKRGKPVTEQAIVDLYNQVNRK